MNCYIAVLCCNFDDVIIGVYEHTEDGRCEASVQAQRFAANPKLRFDLDHQAVDTQAVCAKVFECRDSTEITAIALYEVPEDEDEGGA